MNCVVCILLLRVLHRGSGGGGVSEYDVAEMTSSGSGSQFLLRRGGGEDSEDDGRKKGALDARRRGTGDEERREVPACLAWFCHVAYMRTRKKGIEKDTPVRGLHHGSDLHAFRRRGRSDSAALRMYACTQKNVELRHTSIWTLVSITTGTDSAHLDVPAWCRIYFVFVSRDNDAWLPLSAVLIVAVCAVSSRGLDVDSLHGTAKGDGETGDADATCVRQRSRNRGRGRLCEKRVVNDEESRD